MTLADNSGTDRKVTAKLKLVGPHWELEADVAVPAGPTPIGRLLPTLRGLAETMVEATVRAVEQMGQRISCRAGCGACCRQLVPIAAVEAHRLRELVAALPEPRQTQVRARFADAERRFRDAGMLDRLLEPAAIPAAEVYRFAIRYFQLGVPCPFLEDESCSVYPERPIVCREYLVTSPAEHCARIPAPGVVRVNMPMKVSLALFHLGGRSDVAGRAQWGPLSVVLQWAERHPEPPADRTGPELLHEFFDHLTGKKTAEIAGAVGLMLEGHSAAEGG
jgi:Fe-S-cluster containining protein